MDIPSVFPVRTRADVLFVLAATGLAMLLSSCSAETSLEVFDRTTGIGGAVGTVSYDAGEDVYRLTSGSANGEAGDDAYFYAWRRAAGDLTMTAEVDWQDEAGYDEREAGWMVRASLEPDAAYVGAVVRNDTLIVLEYRQEGGQPIHEIASPIGTPGAMRVERTGHQFTLSITKSDSIDHRIATVTVPLEDSVYAGLAVTSHEDGQQETAIASGVALQRHGLVSEEDRVVESTLEIIDVETGVRRVVRRAKEHFEAPNWSRDGSYLLYNGGGLLYTIPVEGGTPEQLDTGFADNCNNDHGFSPDGSQIVLSHSPEGESSLIYVMSSTGGTPVLVTEKGPSYWHGWSPDGTTLAYCAERDGNYDVYTIPAEGGEETRLTDAEGLDDGPDYSPDGRYIFFNSVRSGQMKIWRMDADGSNPVQMTEHDGYGDWFPHPSPDGRWLVFVSYDEDVEGHPPNEDVVLRLMPMEGGEPRVIATLFGGQGTINVPSWSPDSKEVAFVSYRLVAP